MSSIRQMVNGSLSFDRSGASGCTTISRNFEDTKRAQLDMDFIVFLQWRYTLSDEPEFENCHKPNDTDHQLKVLDIF